MSQNAHVITTRGYQWLTLWRRRVSEYWSLGTVDLTGRL